MNILLRYLTLSAQIAEGSVHKDLCNTDSRCSHKRFEYPGPDQRRRHRVSGQQGLAGIFPRTAVLGATVPGTAVLGATLPRTVDLGATLPRTVDLGATLPRTAVLGATVPRTAVLGATVPRTAVLGATVF